MAPTVPACGRTSLLIALLLLAGPVAARGEAEAPAPAESAPFQYVIPPGQEELLADMLGRGQTLPGGCTFTNGQIEKTAVVGTYTCSGGEVVAELQHPSLAPADAPHTATFALVVRKGALPADLSAALLERIGAREGGFQWKEVGSPVANNSVTRLLTIVAAGLSVVAVLLWAVRRILSGRRAHSG